MYAERVMGGSSDPKKILHVSYSLAKIRLYTENQLPRLPGSALIVCVWVDGVGERAIM